MAVSISRKSLSIIVDVTIVVAAIIFCTLFAKRYFLNDVRPSPGVGTKIVMEGVDWSSKQETVLLVLDKDCHLCTTSAPLYQKLVRVADANHELQLIAVTPDDTSDGKTYLESIGVSISNVKQSALRDLNVPGTPTVLAVDKDGRITESWVGMLTSEQEINLLRHVGAVTGK
jgi:AhpC/TSA family.